MTPFFDKLVKRFLVKEMSERVDSLNIDIGTYERNWVKYRKNMEHVEDITIAGITFSIYLSSSGSFLRFYVSRGDDLVCFISGELLSYDGIGVELCVRTSQSGITIDMIYVDFLLKHFKYIISDKSHTPRGFAIYKLLAGRDDVNVSVVNANLLTTVANILEPDELDKYYGKYRKQYLYKVTKK